MGNKKKKSEAIKPLTVEFKVSMHCKACERTVAKTIAKFKGVEKFITDMGKHKAVVTGKFDPQNILKKLRKKTGKAVEIVADKGVKAKEATDAGDPGRLDSRNSDLLMFNCCKESAQLLVLFSDENPNACCIM